jgi:hypothetical protein
LDEKSSEKSKHLKVLVHAESLRLVAAGAQHHFAAERRADHVHERERNRKREAEPLKKRFVHQRHAHVQREPRAQPQVTVILRETLPRRAQTKQKNFKQNK